ncbi:MAG: peptide deformylase [Chitinispirillaceae bacterium]
MRSGEQCGDIGADLFKRPLKLSVLPDEILREKCEPVTIFSSRLEAFMQEMLSSMKKWGGIGLAAPQVGVSLRAVVLEVGGSVLLLANPEIVGFRKEFICAEEGCLSIPDRSYRVNRSRFVEVRARTASGGRLHFEAEEFFARVLQHEIDHLDGVLICDKC